LFENKTFHRLLGQLSKYNEYIQNVKMFKNETALIANPAMNVGPLFKKWLLASGKEKLSKKKLWPEDMRELLNGRQV
jgi:hypothetical protein